MKRIMFVLFMLSSMMIISCSSPSPSSSSSSDEDDVTLNAKIEKSSTQLVVTNNDLSSWDDVTITINDDYEYKTPVITTGSVNEIGFLLFTASDGKKFNPFDYAVKEVTISAKMDGKYGFVMGNF